MLQIPKTIFNTNIPPITNPQNPHTHFFHLHSTPILHFTHRHLQIPQHRTHHRAGAAPRHRQLLPEPLLSTTHQPHLPLALHHGENPSPPLQHHVPRHPQLLLLLLQKEAAFTPHAKAKHPRLLHAQRVTCSHSGSHDTVAGRHRDGEENVLERETRLRGLLAAARGGSMAHREKAAVGDVGGKGGERGEVGCQDGLPNLIG